MKLLSPFQSQEKQQTEVTRKLLRVQEVEELAKRANERLARAESDFNSVLAKNQLRWLQEEEDHQKMVKEMADEVEILENRKKQALIPIEIYKKEADDLLLEARKIVLRSKEKEENNDILAERLEEKLTEVADREISLKLQEQQLESKKLGISSQQETLKKSVAKLSEEMIAFHEKQKAEEASLLERKKEISLAEINFSAKREKYARDLEALITWDKQLKDERATLERAFARLKQ